MGKAYKAVVFDLDGTLLDFHKCETESLKAACVNAGILGKGNITWSEFWKTYSSINSQYWEQRLKCGLNREKIIENSIRDTFLALGLGGFCISSVSRTYWQLFCQSSFLESGAHEVLKALREKVALGIVTNGYGDAQRGRIRASGLSDYFTTIVISEEVGCAKPDPQIFSIALSMLNVDSSQALYVGDSIENDYLGASKAGIDFCHYDRMNYQSKLDPEPVLRIQRLLDLTKFVLGNL